MSQPKYDREACSNFIISKIEEGLSLFKACEFEGMPAIGTFSGWMNEDKDLSERYARAREIRSDRLFEQMLDIANNEHLTEIINETPNGATITRLDHDKHRRLQIDTIKWAIAKMAPKKYGDKIDVTTNGEKVNQPNIIVNTQQTAEGIKKLLSGE